MHNDKNQPELEAIGWIALLGVISPHFMDSSMQRYFGKHLEASHLFLVGTVCLPPVDQAGTTYIGTKECSRFVPFLAQQILHYPSSTYVFDSRGKTLVQKRVFYEEGCHYPIRKPSRF
jgi:hypothetical protein